MKDEKIFNFKTIALFTSYAFISIGIGIMFDSIGGAIFSFGVLSAWTVLVFIGIQS